MMNFSTEELDFFQDIFTECTPFNDLAEQEHQLSVHTSIPTNLKKVLGASQLTLLAEIGHYQLWFPVKLNINKGGEFSPNLGTPEIIDVQGNQRNWRITAPENVSFLHLCQEKGQNKDHNIEIISLSTSGITLKLPNSQSAALFLNQPALELRLPNEAPITFALDLVRKDENLVSAKFKDFDKGRDSLRKFLFNSHKAKYSDLYQDVIL